jgi:hypothetical protein
MIVTDCQCVHGMVSGEAARGMTVALAALVRPQEFIAALNLLCGGDVIRKRTDEVGCCYDGN